MYEQMEFDVTLDSERELKENVNLAVSFACRQLQNSEPVPVASRYEGYGIMAESFSALQVALKKVQDDMKLFLRILPADDSRAVEASNSLYNSTIEVAYEAIRMASQANRVMTDIYRHCDSETTPLEDYLDSLNREQEEFEEAEEAEENEKTEEEQDG